MTDSAGPQDSPVPGVTPFISHFESAPASARSRHKPSRVPGSVLESSGSRLGRRLRRVRLYAVAFSAVALLVFVVALAVLNTHRVRVDWVFGRSSVALVWLVLLAAILGWLLGLTFAAAFRWRTRAPRRP
jgi:uncharacterized integral membrane protein